TRQRIEVVDKDHPRHESAADLRTQPVPSLPLHGRGDDPAAPLRDFLRSYPGRVVIAADSAGRREVLNEMLERHGLTAAVEESWQAVLQHGARFALTVAELEDGFALDAAGLCVLTERQLFPERANQSRRRRRAAREPEQILRDLSEVAIGAPIVHEDHGVGRFQGLQRIDAGGQAQEFLCIEYAKGDKLYVPVAQLQLV